jgi:tetratricopeptide (TPR) repeat protein/TolB-like protein/DNA-binding winged helix-turn-helix (wHTH) protein
MEVLLVLAEARHEVVTHEELGERVWGDPRVSHTQVSRCVSEIRHALDDHVEVPRFIQTLRGRGYRLVAPISFGSLVPEPLDPAIQADPPQAAGVADAPESSFAGIAEIAENAENADAARPLTMWEELKRRRVVRVGIAYMAVGWAMVEVTSTMFPLLGIPEWVVRAITVIVVVGFPVAVITAWVFQVSPQGVVIDMPRRDLTGSGSPHRFEIAVIGALVIALGIMGFRLFVAKVERPLIGPDIAGQGDPLPGAMDSGPNSIAVLPFLNIGDDAETEYFSDGLAEELTNLFAKVPEMQVASRTASFYYKGRNEPLSTIAEKLRARYVLEGSVRKARDSIRIMAQLIDARTGYHLWSNDYDRTVVDIFDIQGDIAREVTRHIGIALSPESELLLAAQPTQDIDAYDFYLQGRGYWRRPHNDAVLAAAQGLFQRAIDLDPQFADAYAGMCTTLLARFVLESASSWFEQAEKACNRALTLDPDLPEVRIALGNLYRLSGQMGDAILEFEQARKIDPGSDAAALGLGQVYSETGRYEDAERELRRAIALQPGYWLNYNGLGALYYQTGEYLKAADNFRRMIDLVPDNQAAFTNLGAALYMLGDYSGATDAWRRNVELSPSKNAYSNLGLAEYYAGNYAAAADMQREAIRLAPNDPTAYGYLGNALAELPGHEKESRSSYERAIELSNERLRINPQDSKTLTELALVLAAVGRQEEANSVIDKVLSEAPGLPDGYYFAAKVKLLGGDLDTAQAYLERALVLGYSSRLAAADPQLRQIRDLPRMRELLQARSEKTSRDDGEEGR